MKILKATALMITMSFGIGAFAATGASANRNDSAAVAAEQNQMISKAEIRALQQRAEFDTQAAMVSKAGDEAPRYDAHINDQAAVQ